MSFISQVGIINTLDIILSKKTSDLEIRVNNIYVGSDPLAWLDLSRYKTYYISGKQVQARDISVIAKPDTVYYNHTQGLIRYVQNDTLAWNIYRQ